MKLMSMTDFVLNIKELVPKDSDQLFDSWQNKKLSIIENYANFLEEDLKIEMFVPCDINGNFLEDFQQAKNKILFEDFKYGYKWYESFIVMRDKKTGEGQFILSKYKKIQGLLNNSFDFELTPNAIKRIFG